MIGQHFPTSGYLAGPRLHRMQLEYDTAWLQAFLRRASGLLFDHEQVAQVRGLAERNCWYWPDASSPSWSRQV
jgi:hypothetical protein